jgi:hypothetical protein
MLHLSSNRFAHSPSPDSRVLTPSAAIPAVARMTARKRRGVLRPSWRRSPHLFFHLLELVLGRRATSAARGFRQQSTYRRNRRACNGRGCEAPVPKTAPLAATSIQLMPLLDVEIAHPSQSASFLTRVHPDLPQVLRCTLEDLASRQSSPRRIGETHWQRAIRRAPWR